jgi:hypothetical protein
VYVVLAADHAAVVDEEERRIAADVPARGDRPRAVGLVPVPPASPGDLTAGRRLFELFALVHVVDPQDDERQPMQPLEGRAHSRINQFATAAMLVAAEVEQHHFAAKLGESYPLAVDVLADDLEGLLADGEAPDL